MAESIASIIKVCVEVGIYLGRAWGARKDCIRLRLELRSVEGVLETLQETIKDAETNYTEEWTATIRTLNKDKAKGPLAQLNGVLDEITSALGDVTSGKFFKTLGHSLAWPFKQGEVDRWVNTMERMKSTFILALENDQVGLSKAVLSLTRDTKEAVERIEGRLERQEKQQEKRLDDMERERKMMEREEILRWVSQVDHKSRQQGNIKDRLEGTGRWILDSPEFTAWLSGEDSGALLCHGIPGAGKTIISATVIEHLCSTFEKDATVGVAYVYYRYDSPQEQASDVLLLSLSKQLAEKLPEVPDDWQTAYGERKTAPPADASAMLRSVAQKFKRIYFVLDALDECQYRDTNQDRSALEMMLAELSDQRGSLRTHVFATSRPNANVSAQFTAYFGEVPQVPIEARDQDINRYADNEMVAFWRKHPEKKTGDFQEKIRTKVRESAMGMFLLAKLHMTTLASCRNLGKLREALDKIQHGPASLDRKYDEAMNRINRQEEGDRELAVKALSWITRAKRLLTVKELLHVLAINQGDQQFNPDYLDNEDDLSSVCAGLITIDPAGNLVRWIHYTTKEYFERNWEKLLSSADRDIAATCITYLSFDTFDSGACGEHGAFEDRRSANPLYHYAAKHLGDHIAGDFASSQQVLDFLSKERHVQAAGQAALLDEREGETFLRRKDFWGTGGMTKLHLAAYFGWDGTLRELQQIEALRLNAKDDSGRTPLFYAAERGHLGVVEFLLGSRRRVRIDDKVDESRTPLSYAAGNGHDAIASLLLKQGASADSGYTRDDRRFKTPLAYAARGGHSSVVQLLLENGADAEAYDIMDATPLFYATQHGDEATIRLLLDKGGADVNTSNYKGTSALAHLVDHRNMSLVRLFLARGAHPETGTYEEGNMMDSPLFSAIVGGDAAMAKLLLDTGKVYPDPSEDWEGRSGFSLAAERGHKDVILLLLGYEKVEVNYGSRTPLSYAAGAGREEVVEVLLANSKVLPDSEDHEGRTPLSHAAAGGHSRVVNLLLSNSHVKPDSRDKAGMTPLSWAIRGGHKAVADLLLSNPNVNPASTDEHGLTQVAQAARDGNLASLEELLAITGKPSAKTADFNGRTPLLHAARNGHVSIIKALLHTGEVDAGVADMKSRTPLHYAARNGHTDAVQLLLGTPGVSPDQPDQDGRTPLSHASKRGQRAIVELLLTLGRAKPDLGDNDGRTPLSHAAALGHVEGKYGLLRDQEADYGGIVALLLNQYKVDPNAADNSGRTPLWWAVWGENEKRGIWRGWAMGRSDDSDSEGDKDFEAAGCDVLKQLLAKPGLHVNAPDSSGQTPLMCAAKNDLKSVVKLLLADSRTDPGARDGDGRSIPWWAAEKNNRRIFAWLLADSRVHLDSQDGWTPLWWAARNGDEQMCALLLKEDGLDPECKDEDGRTALSHATEQGQDVVVRLLLEDPRVDPNSKDKNGQTPVWWAVENGYKWDVGKNRHDTIERLLTDERTSASAMAGWTPLWWAAMWSPEATVRRLLAQAGVDPDLRDGQGRTPLSCAVEYGSDKVVGLFLADDRVDANSLDNSGLSPLCSAIKHSALSLEREERLAVIRSLLAQDRVRVVGTGRGEDQVLPLVWAARNRHEDIFLSIISRHEVDPNARDSTGCTALDHAAGSGMEKATRALLEAYSGDLDLEPTDYWGRTPLSKAAEYGHAGVVKMLIDTGRVDVNSKDRSGMTPLMRAARNGREAVVCLLLDGGYKIDINLRNESAKTPLILAAEATAVGVLRLLLATGNVDVNARDDEGRTALSHAAGRYDGKAAVELLLAAEGIDVNPRDDNGRTPLSYAAAGWAHGEIVELLLGDARADPEIKDGQGLTPLDHARKEGRRDSVKLLAARTEGGIDDGYKEEGRSSSDRGGDDEEGDGDDNDDYDDEDETSSNPELRFYRRPRTVVRMKVSAPRTFY